SPFQVFNPSNGWPMIRMLPESGCPYLVLQRFPGTVQPDAQLLFYDLFLSGEFLLRKSSISHSTGLDLERRLPSIRGKSEVVSCEIQPRKSIVGTAILQGYQVDFPLSVPVGPLKKHVFEEMGLTSLAEFLVLRTDSIPHDCGDDRAVVDLLGQNGKAIVQNCLLNSAS